MSPAGIQVDFGPLPGNKQVKSLPKVRNGVVIAISLLLYLFPVTSRNLLGPNVGAQCLWSAVFPFTTVFKKVNYTLLIRCWWFVLFRSIFCPLCIYQFVLYRVFFCVYCVCACARALHYSFTLGIIRHPGIMLNFPLETKLFEGSSSS